MYKCGEILSIFYDALGKWSSGFGTKPCWTPHLKLMSNHASTSLCCYILLAGIKQQSKSVVQSVFVPPRDHKQSDCKAVRPFKPPIHFWISALVMMTESCSEGLLWCARRALTNLASVLRDASFPIRLSNTALSQVCPCAAVSLQLVLHSGWVFSEQAIYFLWLQPPWSFVSV